MQYSHAFSGNILMCSFDPVIKLHKSWRIPHCTHKQSSLRHMKIILTLQIALLLLEPLYGLTLCRFCQAPRGFLLLNLPFLCELHSSQFCSKIIHLLGFLPDVCNPIFHQNFEPWNLIKSIRVGCVLVPLSHS